MESHTETHVDVIYCLNYILKLRTISSRFVNEKLFKLSYHFSA